MKRNSNNNIIFTILISFIILNYLPIKAEADENPQEQKILVLENRLKINTESLDAVRRDQLNYNIEKNLLKEAYASNMQTINLIIALILGSLTILGYAGVRSINSIKKDFKGELDNLILLRSEFDLKMRDVDDQLLNAKKRYDELAQVNEKQDKRLQILEIQEKSAALIKEKNFSNALRYIDIGLSLSSHDISFLSMKALCLLCLKRFDECIFAYEILLSQDSNNISAITNLIELYLLTGKREKSSFLCRCICQYSVPFMALIFHGTYLHLITSYQETKRI